MPFKTSLSSPTYISCEARAWGMNLKLHTGENVVTLRAQCRPMHLAMEIPTVCLMIRKK